MMNNMMNNMMFNNNNNQTGMNNIGVNPMGLNNQPNIMNGMMMDQTALNIKNIVEPYEKRISELEEKIKQKDFEIAVLKQKLNNNNLNNNSIMNQMNQINMMNMNPLLPMNMMVPDNAQILNKGKKITINIQLDNNINKIECFEYDKASIINEKCNNNNGFFIFNYKKIEPNLSLKDNGINNYCTIYIKPKVINLIFNYNGVLTTLVLSDDCSLDIALHYYIIKQGNPFFLRALFHNDISFLYNAKGLGINDKTPINIIFGYNPTITVVNNSLKYNLQLI